MSVSLHVKLRELQQCGALELRFDAQRHYFPLRRNDQGEVIDPGEGSYFYKGEPLRIETAVWTPGPEQKDLQEVLRKGETVFNEPHDLAWCPQQKVLVAYATSVTEEFDFTANGKFQAEANSERAVV